MVSITGLLVTDGLGTVLPVVLLLVLVGLCRGWVWAADLRHHSRETRALMAALATWLASSGGGLVRPHRLRPHGVRGG